MKNKIRKAIVYFILAVIFGLFPGCQTTGRQTRDPSHNPYNIDNHEEKG